MTDTNIWKDAPEGTEFIVEFNDGEVHYYKTIYSDLMVCTPLSFDEESLSGEVVGWRKSHFDNFDELYLEGESGRKEIHHKLK